MAVRRSCHTPVVRSPGTEQRRNFPADATNDEESKTGKEESTVERDQALEMALGQIEKQYGKGAIMRLGE